MKRLLMAALFLLLPGLVFARGDGLTELRYTPADSYENHAKIVRSAINEAMKSVNFIVRGVARKRVERVLEPPREIDIAFDDATIVVQFDDKKRFESPADGRTITTRTSDGNRLQVSQKFIPNGLVQRVESDEGVRTTRFHFDEEQKRMTMEVEVEADKLDESISYRLDYRRR